MTLHGQVRSLAPDDLEKAIFSEEHRNPVIFNPKALGSVLKFEVRNFFYLVLSGFYSDVIGHRPGISHTVKRANCAITVQ